MKLLIKIAWRNIMRHRGKSLVIGVILFVGALLMTIGNGVISGMDKGLRENIINGFTGDIVLVAEKQESDNVLLDMMATSIEPIYNFKQVDSLLRGFDEIKTYIPVGKNGAMVLNEEGGSPGFTYMIGVDFERYRKVYPNTMKAIEGRFLKPGEKGVMVPTGARKEMFEATNIWFVPKGCKIDTSTMFPEAKEALSNLVNKDEVVFMGMSDDNTSTDIRLSITGIIKYNALNTLWGHFAFVDIESYRNCLGYISAADKKTVSLSNEEKTLLGDDDLDLDALFSGNGLVENNPNSSTGPDMTTAPTDENKSQESVEAADLDDGAYNLVFIHLKDHVKLKETVDTLNNLFKEHDAKVRAITWKKAIGSIGSMAMLIKTALFMFVMFLFFVAIIIIINTLSMAALERTSEIGMMRAVGAHKAFISTMFLWETALLSTFFGGIGIVAGYIVVKVLSLLKFTTGNDMVQLLYGGDTFQPFLSLGDIGTAILQLVIVTIIAVVYPVLVARSITPLDAITRE